MDLKKLEVLLRAAANGYVDLCFFSLIRSGPFEYINLVDDPMMVVLYPGHPLAKKRAIALEDLKDEPCCAHSIRPSRGGWSWPHARSARSPPPRTSLSATRRQRCGKWSRIGSCSDFELHNHSRQTLCLPRMVFKYVLFTTRLRVPLLPKPIWLQQQ